MTDQERWHQNGFNTWEVIVIRDGPDAQGRNYVDGRHQVHVAFHESSEAAAAACAEHNARMLFDVALRGHAQWDEMSEAHKDRWRARAKTGSFLS